MPMVVASLLPLATAMMTESQKPNFLSVCNVLRSKEACHQSLSLPAIKWSNKMKGFGALDDLPHFSLPAYVM